MPTSITMALIQVARGVHRQYASRQTVHNCDDMPTSPKAGADFALPLSYSNIRSGIVAYGSARVVLGHKVQPYQVILGPRSILHSRCQYCTTAVTVTHTAAWIPVHNLQPSVRCLYSSQLKTHYPCKVLNCPPFARHNVLGCGRPQKQISECSGSHSSKPNEEDRRDQPFITIIANNSAGSKVLAAIFRLSPTIAPGSRSTGPLYIPCRRTIVNLTRTPLEAN
jgi:hypothetical protein